MMAPQPAVTTMSMGQMPAATSTMMMAPMIMQEPVPSGTFAVAGMSQATVPGQQLVVEVVRATGLHHMNHFTGDSPYVQCEVKHLDRHARETKATTTPVTMGDTLNPFWGERLELQPWQPGEDLEFTVYDKGLIGAKTEGRVLLPSNMFYPNGFNGNLPISGLQGALLQIVVQPAGAGAYAMGAPTSTYSMTGASGGAAYSSPLAYSAGTPTSGVTYSSNTAPAMTFSAGTPTSAAGPVTTMIGSSATYGAAQPAMPVQTYSAPTTAYSTSTPVYSGAAPQISTTSAMAMPAQTYAAQTISPAPTYASQPMQTVLEPVQTSMMGGGQMYGADGAYKLLISIMRAQNLKHMNNFTGDKPYVVCEAKHNSHHERRTMVQTQEVTIGDTLNPQWNESLELEPWHPGESLEFTIYDKGLLGSRTEAKAELQGEMFFSNPNGWSGALPMANHPEMLLFVAVRVLGPSAMSAYHR